MQRQFINQQIQDHQEALIAMAGPSHRGALRRLARRRIVEPSGRILLHAGARLAFGHDHRALTS